jgi:hypothetical protein
MSPAFKDPKMLGWLLENTDWVGLAAFRRHWATAAVDTTLAAWPGWWRQPAMRASPVEALVKMLPAWTKQFKSTAHWEVFWQGWAQQSRLLDNPRQFAQDCLNLLLSEEAAPARLLRGLAFRAPVPAEAHQQVWRHAMASYPPNEWLRCCKRWAGSKGAQVMSTEGLSAAEVALFAWLPREAVPEHIRAAVVARYPNPQLAWDDMARQPLSAIPARFGPACWKYACLPPSASLHCWQIPICRPC